MTSLIDTKYALTVAAREFVRMVILAVVPVLIVQLEQNTIDWRAIGIVAAVAFLRALDSFVREWEGTSLPGITPMK
jgi:hypothetical protein